jgi:hypothetical protein
MIVLFVNGLVNDKKKSGKFITGFCSLLIQLFYGAYMCDHIQELA